MCEEDDGDTDLEDAVAGEWVVRYIDTDGAYAAGFHIWDVCEEYGDATSPYQQLFDKRSSGLRNKLGSFTRYDDYGLGSDNVLVVDRIAILPEHRGHGYGLATLIGLIQQFQLGAGLIAIKPYPLQFEGKDTDSYVKYRLAEFTAAPELAMQRLRRRYGALGFKPVRGTSLMVMPSYTKLPQIDDLVSWPKAARAKE